MDMDVTANSWGNKSFIEAIQGTDDYSTIYTGEGEEDDEISVWEYEEDPD